ncbi:hypothetical protein BRD15_12175 [Halobacteriales archaeon SW_6_65_15]|nr:MAG: hypothetical protein BRD15_12175 [Halobacteriales archaeon SW_6_65_15]
MSDWENSTDDAEENGPESQGSGVASEDELRESIDHAASGAPAAGWAVGDRFSADEIFERILASADEEIPADKKRLFFSGLTAGFAIVLTFLGHAVGTATFPDNRFLGAILYPIGFLYIILGHYQLYTENTLPPVALVLRLASFPLLMRVWVVVLIANDVGAGLGTYLLANWGNFTTLLIEHLELVFVSELLAIAVTVPLGIIATRNDRAKGTIETFGNVAQTIPPLAVIALMNRRRWPSSTSFGPPYSSETPSAACSCSPW